MAHVPSFDRITVEPGRCAGKPCIRGLRITVRRVLEILATHQRREEIFREYPFLEEEDLQQALAYRVAAVRRRSSSLHVMDVGLDRAEDLEILDSPRQQSSCHPRP